VLIAGKANSSHPSLCEGWGTRVFCKTILGAMRPHLRWAPGLWVGFVVSGAS
jgi:hypothetical protein